MQLGTRWRVGEEPPAAVPGPLRDAVAQVESELAREGVDAATWRWTLTWLEGRPIAELDDGTRLAYRPDEGAVLRTDPRD